MTLIISPPDQSDKRTNTEPSNAFLQKVQAPVYSKVDARGQTFSTTWTKERTELAKKLWDDGLSATMIARELGGVTRNAVIGKVDREKWTKRKSRVFAGTLAVERRRDGGSGAVRSIAMRALTGKRPLPKERPIPTHFLRVTFADLQPDQCHNVRGETPATFLFCGQQPQQEGSSYCAWCHSINHVVVR